MEIAMPWHTVHAPAKLNRFLHITGRREDGYHTLQSLIVRIGLFDVLHFRPRWDGVIRLLNPQEGIPADKDLIIRAAKALQLQTGTPHGTDILIDKRIPMGAGLGGGSSDAATTLITLNKLWQTDLSNTALAEIGVRLGSDIPFFIEGGRAAWVEGIGEKVTPVQPSLPVAYCIMHPPVHVPTAEVYGAPGLRRADPAKAIGSLNDLSDYLKWDNAMEETARALFPTLDRYAVAFSQWAKEMGWPVPKMSGSGACFFISLSETQWVDDAGAAGALSRARDFFQWRAKLDVPNLWLVPQL